jgi:carbon-monoxide dehydrogenase medium subunit
MLTTIEFPAIKSSDGTAYVKLTHPASRYAVVGVAARVTVKRGACSAARVVIGGATPSPLRLTTVEDALLGKKAEAIGSVAALTGDALGHDLLSDVFASADYRRAMAAVYAKRALTAAFARATV